LQLREDRRCQNAANERHVQQSCAGLLALGSQGRAIAVPVMERRYCEALRRKPEVQPHRGDAAHARLCGTRWTVGGMSLFGINGFVIEP
jgi:hypothetical protein